jgi:hypothetical protein
MCCSVCGTNMRYLGMDREGSQYFACHQDGCERQHKPLRRWWEAGTDFHIEFVES